MKTNNTKGKSNNSFKAFEEEMITSSQENVSALVNETVTLTDTFRFLVKEDILTKNEIITYHLNKVTKKKDELKLLLDSLKIRKTILENLPEILKNIEKPHIFLKELSLYPETKEVISTNINEILDSIPPRYLITANKYLGIDDTNIKNKLNKKIHDNQKEVLDDLFSAIIISKDSVFSFGNHNEYRKIFSESLGRFVFENVLLDLMEKQNLDFSDIEFNVGGGFSSVLLIGNKVLKVGRTRNTPNIPDSKYILRPYIRNNFPLDVFDKEVCIEVTDRIEELEITNENYLKLYKLFKNMYDEEILPTDFSFDNVGKLVTSNVPFWNGKNHVCSNHSLNIVNNPSKENGDANAGELVILDLDFLETFSCVPSKTQIENSSLLTQAFFEEFENEKCNGKYQMIIPENLSIYCSEIWELDNIDDEDLLIL